jgi:uncharacterized protein YqjF (DUF2071 family)
MKTFLKAQWQNLIMVNYEIEPAALLSYLPKGVELDYHNGKVYVSLVGFLFKDSSIFNIPVPLMGTFEEVNLRFYVLRKVGNETRRGVVFINETVPNKIVAWVANKLYKEHYTAIPTKHKWVLNSHLKEIQYQWKVKSKWNHMKVEASATKHKMETGSMEEFIFEHYYGYTKINSQITQEYKVNHPRWQVNKLIDYSIHCDFTSMYGNDFSFLNKQKPNSVIIAEGSPVTVNWKRTKF